MKNLISVATILCSVAYNITLGQTPSWQRINTGYALLNGETAFEVTQNCIYLYNTNYSTLIRSKNQGLTWDSLYVPSDSSHHEYMDMRFIDDSTAYTVGYDGSLFSGFGVAAVAKKTTDRGLTWQKISNGLNNNNLLLFHVNFTSPTNGIIFAGGQGATERYATTNAGSSWSFVPDPAGPNKQIKCPSVHYSGFGGSSWFASGFGTKYNLAVSQNGGSSWSTLQIPSANGITGLQFFDPSNGVMISNDSIFITNSGGASINAKRKFHKVIRSFGMVDMQRGFFCGDTSIYYTPDAGVTWIHSFSDPNFYMGHLRISGNSIYVSTYGDSIILKLDITNLPISVNENQGAKTQLKVYPNPASSHLFLELPYSADPFQIGVYDQLGRQVKKTVYDSESGLDLQGLAPGCYLLNVENKDHRCQASFVKFEAD